MDVQFSLSAPTFIAAVRGQPLTVDVSKLPEAGLRKVFEYGLQRILNDAAAGAVESKDDKGNVTETVGASALAKATARWEALVSGTVRSATRGDPVEREAIALAEKAIVDAKMKNGSLKKRADANGDEVRAMALKLVEANPSYRDRAKVIIASRNDVEEIDLDALLPDDDAGTDAA